jgi:nucleotide-binding universal stress UspA family protein
MKKILIPTDFSPIADRAVQYAFGLSKHHEGEYLFFHAGKASTEELQKKITHLDAYTVLKERQAHFICSDVDFSAKLMQELINEHEIDLVVMGTHGGKTPIAPMVFGSNTTALVESTSVPVIAVPAEYSFKGISKIAYASDLAKMKMELRAVVAFARSMNASVNIFHVVPVFPDLGAEDTDVETIVESVKKEQNFPYITYQRDNQLASGIENYLAEHPSDLLVVFHLNRSWFDKILDPGASVREIVSISIPIMVFPKKV